MDGGAGPSDPTGGQSFGLVVAPRYLPPALRPRLGWWDGDLHTTVPDTSTEWKPSSPEEFIRPPLPLKPFWAGDIDSQDGPSDPNGGFTFGLTVQPPFLRRAKRPRLGWVAGDPHTEAPDESTEWRPISPEEFIRSPLPLKPFWQGDLDSGAGPSDPDGSFSYQLTTAPGRLTAKGLPPPSVFDGNDLSTPVSDSDPDGDYTYRLTLHPDRLERRRPPEFPSWAGDALTPPSDPTGEFTFQLTYGPSYLPPKRAFLGEFAGDIHTLGDFVPPASNYQGLLLLGVGS